MITETERLILRELGSKDARDFFELNNDPQVLRYTGDEPFNSLSEAEDFLKNYSHYSEHGFGRWAIIRKEDDEFLGWCGLKFNEENSVDIGFRIYQKYWGKGYATEAARKSLEIGFSQFGLKEIIGRTAKENVGSVRVLEKIGMKYFKNGECHGIEDALYFRVKKTY